LDLGRSPGKGESKGSDRGSTATELFVSREKELSLELSGFGSNGVYE
jgi:hypothetical protein